MYHCLIVTEDTPVRDVVKVGLQETGAFEAVESTSAEMALRRVKASPYHLVVVDEDLGEDLDAIDLVEEIRQVAGEAEFLLVSRGDKKSGKKSTHAVSGVIRLPVEASDFFSTVARLLERMQAG